MKRLLQKLANVLGYKVTSLNYRQVDIDFILQVMHLASGNVHVVQVGANDGITNDPVFSSIHKWGSKVLLVEPQTDVFQRLQENYKQFERKIYFENKAIAITRPPQRLILYGLDEKAQRAYKEQTGWNPTGIVSANKQWVIRALHKSNIYTENDAAKRVVQFEVETEDINQLLRKYDFRHVDFLQIDAEGADFKIIRTIDMTFVKPKIINFEFKYLPDKKEVVRYMEHNHYRLFYHGRDCLAVLTKN